jgi:hypothetical protein
MKWTVLVVLSTLLVPPVFADASQQLIPAGSLISCTTGDARISSKTTAVGDPVLCRTEHRRGDSMLPYGSLLGGEFSAYKNPGHFVGKGWMQLDFDRLYVGNTVVPIDAKVVDVPGYKIDSEGRILGKGHAVRDAVEWMIPVLWPLDLINLPRRGPKPTLKAETALTLRVMEDIQVPQVPEPQRDPYGLYQRQPDAYAPQPPTPAPEPDSAPESAYAAPQEPEAPPPAVAYAAPVPYPVPVPYYAPPVVVAPYPAGFAFGYGYCCGYGGFRFGARLGVYAYGPRVYPGGPGVRAYAPGVRAYGYGYAGRGAVTRGYAPGGAMMASRGGMGYGRASGGARR